MAAPQISNLLSRPRKGPPPQRNNRPNGAPTSHKTSTDAIIQATDSDAALSRLSAANLSYFSDPFAAVFVPQASHTTSASAPTNASPPSSRRMPIINRGTYVRTTAIDALVHEFLDRHNGRVQVVSLGAGSDTRLLRFVGQEGEKGEKWARRVVWHEIDFAEATRAKIEVLMRTPWVWEVLRRAVRVSRGAKGGGRGGEAEDGGTTPTQLTADADMDAADKGDDGIHISPFHDTLTSAIYNLHALDLRTLAASNPPAVPNLDPDLPTLLLSECCLTYLPSTTTTTLLTHFASHLIPAPIPLSIIMYEPLLPHDAFGRTMSANLASRGISMPGLEACPTLERHAERLRGIGFEGTKGVTVGQWWDKRVDGVEKEKLRGVEGLDEEEEWVLLAAHYGFVWGWRGAASDGSGGGGREEMKDKVVR